MKIAFILISAALLSGCAQINCNITQTGEGNKLTATCTVDKTTEDLIDAAGSAYGDAASNQGARQ